MPTVFFAHLEPRKDGMKHRFAPYFASTLIDKTLFVVSLITKRLNGKMLRF